jgi:ankyrin repeat protein
VWANEEQQNPNELKKKLLLAKDFYGKTAWHQEAIFGRLAALENLWSWAKEVELSPDALLLAQSERGQTVLHMAAEKNHTEILQKLWMWAEEAQQNANELKKE